MKFRRKIVLMIDVIVPRVLQKNVLVFFDFVRPDFFSFRMLECNVCDARDQVNNGLAQIQRAMKEMQTELEAVMCLCHVADDKERGRMHLTVGYRKVKAKVEQGLYIVRHNTDKLVKKVQRLEREKVKEEEGAVTGGIRRGRKSSEENEGRTK